MDRRENNVRIFRDTETLCRTNKRLADAIRASNEGQYIVAEAGEVEGGGRPRRDTPAKIVISKKRSLEAASAYAGKKICVHNFASATNPGGGVTKGSSAQEEAICRCSTLYFNLTEPAVVNGFHNLHRGMLKNGVMNATYNADCVFTPGVVVFKSDIDFPELLPEEQWYSIDVITCAAPNLRENPSNNMNPGSGNRAVRLKDSELLELHIKRVTRILEIARAEGAEVVILGAFGCGAFRNPPNVVAEAMYRVIKEFRCDFETIEFAVYCTPQDTKNYEAFSRRLGSL